MRTHCVSTLPLGQDWLTTGGVVTGGVVVGGVVTGGVVTGGGVVGDPEHARQVVMTAANTQRRRVKAEAFNA